MTGFSPWLRGVLICCLAWVFACDLPECQAQLNERQQLLLEEMDAQLAAKIVAAVAKVQVWRDRIERARAAAKAIDGAQGDPAEVAAVVLEIAPELKTLATSHPKFAELVKYEQRVDAVLKKADQTWRTAKYEAEKFPNLNEKQFREQAKQQALAVASQELREYFGAEIFAQIDQMRDPAAYAENFLNGEFKKWISQPMKVGDDGSLVVQVVPPPAGVSIFSKTARLGVEIDYLPNQLKVRATGLYFRYRPGTTPVPVTDELKMEVDYEQSAINNVKALGEEMLAESLGAPIKVTLKNKPDFTAGANGLRGGIPFDVQFSMFQKVDVKGIDLVLYPGNKIDWKDGTLKIDYKLDSPVPIGTTPFAFWTFGGDYGPRERKVAFKTKISIASPPGPSIVALDVGCGTTFPVKYIEVDGKLLIANVGIAETKGKLDFEHGTLDASFKTSEEAASMIPGFSLGEGKLHLQREYLTVDSKMELFGTKFDEMHGEFSFVDGSGSLTSVGDFKLFGVNFARELQAELGSGFSYLVLRSVDSVEVPGIKPYGSISCTVIVEGDTRNGNVPLKIMVKTFRPELDVTIPVARLDECTIELLQREINKKAVQSYHQFLKELANADKQGRKLAAQWDQKSRNWADKNLGGRWESGVPELDEFGGQLSQEWKDAGGKISDTGKLIGGGAAQLSHQVQDTLKVNLPTKSPPWSPF